MSDVAHAAGVARVTVSRVLANPESVKPATRAAVQEAIAKLGYVPNLNAGTLASSRSRIVGCVVPSLSNAWFAETIDGLSDVLADANYQLLLAQSRYDPAQELRAASTLLGRRVDALVLTGVDHAPGLHELVHRAHIPIVETWDLPGHRDGIEEAPLDMIAGFSNVKAGETAGVHLLARDCRCLGFIGADEERARKRLRGFASVVEREGRGPVATWLGHPPTTFEAGATALRQLLERSPKLDAVFCGNDTLAAGVLFECRRSGVRVPHDIAVMGFSDQPIAAATEPAITTVAVQARALGQQAGRMLLRRLENKPAPQPSPMVADLGYRIVVRESA
ncbi:LacI family DNA-binding transcriptional regulator [Acidovorax sp.]|uniref:LacI family DNA-binding transcriptional regulator n=1 Tax=Acidovorax sp. TaxID=1872122 RepID=UPI00403846B6